MGEFFKLHCTNCGNALEIPTGIEQFACGTCGVAYQVKRGGGIVSIVALMKDTESKVTVPGPNELAGSEQNTEGQPQETLSPISEESSSATSYQEKKLNLEEPAKITAPPAAKPVWPVEREPQPAWQNPPRRRNIQWGKYFLYLLIFGIILAWTNPSKERHETVIGDHFVEYMKRAIGELGGQIEGQGGGLGELVGQVAGSLFGDFAKDIFTQLDFFQYNNYYLFSTTTLGDQVISFGILRFVTIVTPAEEWKLDEEFRSKLEQFIPPDSPFSFLLTPFPQMLTQVPSTPNLPPTNTAIPIIAPTKIPTKQPIPTVIKTETPIVFATKTPSGLNAFFTANESMYCRAGPDVSYDEYTLVLKGQTVPALAKWFNNNWILVGIDNPDTRTKCCWVGGDGDLNVLLTSLQSINTLPDRIDCPYYP